MGAVRVEYLGVGGWEPPHGLKIELVGNIDTLVDDDIVLVMHEYGQEFQKAVAEAFERIFLQRLRNGEYKWANRHRAACGTAPCAPQPTTAIEDIEL